MADNFEAFVTAMAALPTQTYPQTADLLKALTRMGQIQFGTYTGTGVAISVATDGAPKLVVLVDVTQVGIAFHITGMAAASFLSVDNGATSYQAANGITLGTDGFTIGTNALINTGGDSGFWFAVI